MKDFDDFDEVFDFNDQEEDEWRFPDKDAILVVIDCTRSMVEREVAFNDSPSSQRGIQCALSLCQELMVKKALKNVPDLIGVVLMRTRTASNDDQAHITVLFDLDKPSVPRILKLESLAKLSAREFDDLYGSWDSAQMSGFQMKDLLWSCQNLFSLATTGNQQNKLGYKRVWFMTDDPDPHPASDQEARKLAFVKASDMRDSQFHLDVVPIVQFPSEFRFDEFWHALLFKNNFVKSFREVMDAITQDSMGTMPETKQRMLARFNFYLNPCKNIPSWLLSDSKCSAASRPTETAPDPDLRLAVGVSIFCLNRRTNRPQGVFLHGDQNQVVTSRRVHRLVESREQLLDHDLDRSIKMGSKLVCFDSSEVKTTFRKFCKPGLYLLGFQSFDKFRPQYHFKPSQFMFIDPESVDSSGPWFLALVKRCLAKQVHPICLYQFRDCMVPRLVALFPQEERYNLEQDELEQPWGFHIIFMPYADDFTQVPDLPKETDERDIPEPVLQSVGKIVDGLTLQDSRFDPSQFCNPSLQKFYSALLRYALGRDTTDVTEDLTKPDLARIRSQVGAELANFKTLVNLPDNLPSTTAAGSKRPAMGAAYDRNYTKRPLTINLESLRKLAQSKNLDSLTVPLLKEALKLLNVQPIGSKKADLVQLVTKSLQ